MECINMTNEVNKVELEEVVETADVTEVPNEGDASQISIQISDIIDALKVIEVAIERGTFKAPELVSVMPVYQKLQKFAAEVQKAEKQGE